MKNEEYDFEKSKDKVVGFLIAAFVVAWLASVYTFDRYTVRDSVRDFQKLTVDTVQAEP